MPEIIVTSGDIFESGCRAIVNPVDCTGAQGAGLAKAFGGRFPSARDEYRRHCESLGANPGDVWAYHAAGVWLLFAATKDNWRDPSRLEWVERALRGIVREVNIKGIRSVAVPALGCGLGQRGIAKADAFGWADVLPLIRSAAERMNCDVVKLYEPR